MDVQYSDFLTLNEPLVKELVEFLSGQYSFVSVLATDCFGTRYSVTSSSTSVKDSMWSERGFVVRVYNEVQFAEYAFNTLTNQDFPSILEQLKSLAVGALSSIPSSLYVEDEMEKSFFGKVERLYTQDCAEEIIQILSAIEHEAKSHSPHLVDFSAIYEGVNVNKLYYSSNKILRQAYQWSQGYLIPVLRRGDCTRYNYGCFSGLKGLELLSEMAASCKETVETVNLLLEAEPMKPGRYDVICSPEVVGLIAHEAFGHGVELDMFIRNRAKAQHYLDKAVASEITNMRDGAASALHVSSYFFDDEGILASDTKIIENGILKKPISDLLSAMEFGSVPTGNGKRESFEHKAYSRMTNTFFEAGSDNLDEMIASVSHGYFLDGAMSGMEDPKNWGIQCMLLYAREICDGKLTENYFSPVIFTGSVVELLQSITMVSSELQLFGSGACGKGYKEWVKVSDGGPYMKMSARLG